MDNKIKPRDRSESEIAGYRDLYKFSSAKGGNYKSTDNVIEEILSNGTKYIRFKPVDAFTTK